MSWVSFRQVSAGVLLLVSLSGCDGVGVRRSDAPLQGSPIELEIPDSAPAINPDADRARYQSWKTCVDLLYRMEVLPKRRLGISNVDEDQTLPARVVD